MPRHVCSRLWSAVRILGVLGNAPIILHAALMNGHDRPKAVSPIDEDDYWRLGGTALPYYLPIYSCI